MLNLDACAARALIMKPDLDVGRVGPVRSNVPEIAKPPGRLPDHDLAPVHLPAGRCAFEDSATNSTYTGPMLLMIWRSIPDLGPSFTQFANGLKHRAESGR